MVAHYGLQILDTSWNAFGADGELAPGTLSIAGGILNSDVCSPLYRLIPAGAA
jgi:hypothetical protein